MKKIFFYALVLFILPIHTSTFMLQHCAQAQMPGWLSVRDHDGTLRRAWQVNVFPTSFDELVRITGGTPADVGA